jgi:hypothetical protein
LLLLNSLPAQKDQSNFKSAWRNFFSHFFDLPPILPFMKRPKQFRPMKSYGHKHPLMAVRQDRTALAQNFAPAANGRNCSRASAEGMPKP